VGVRGEVSFQGQGCDNVLGGLSQVMCSAQEF